jgi:peptidoglycan/LPS O-acetylase OafA/YrhL
VNFKIQIRQFDITGTNFITGMRAWAAGMTVLIHSGGAGLRDCGALGNYLADLGRTGVYVFFVISGYCVAVSFSNSKSYTEYLMKRLARIVPLYYFWLLVGFMIHMSGASGANVSIYDLTHWLTFTSSFTYATQKNAMIGVEWSIPIEVFWYLFIPAGLMIAKNVHRAVALVIAAMIVVLVLRKLLNRTLPYPPDVFPFFFHWSPIPYAISFGLGILAYRIRQTDLNQRSLKLFTVGGLLTIPIFAIATAFLPTLERIEFLVISFATTLIIATGRDTMIVLLPLFNSKIVQYVGVLSYSIYLSHPIVIFGYRKLMPQSSSQFLDFIIIFGLTIILSYMTHTLIENRGTQLLRKYLADKQKVLTI